MTKVFIGGSRRISRLPAEVQERLERIIDKKLPVLVGDANGADRLVQEYLSERAYDNVEVFCMEGLCRNNIGGWNTRTILPPKSAKGAQYYSLKDQEMTRESTVGLMVWDGKSRGTLANISRLLDQGKKVVVYMVSQSTFFTLSDKEDWKTFLNHSTQEPPRRRRRHTSTYNQIVTT
jgi:hypothetical protein